MITNTTDKMKHTKEQLAQANEFLKECNVFGIVHAKEGGFINLDSLLCDFVEYVKNKTIKEEHNEK